MNCSSCGGDVAVGRMQCTSCGHDMLVEDLARRPTSPRNLSLATSVGSFLRDTTERLHPTRHLNRTSPEDLARSVELNERLKRDRWRVVLVPLVLLAFFVVSELVRS